MNGKLKRIVLESQCSIYVGDKGSGKSCLMALASQSFLNAGYRVFCNYPYKGCFRIPYTEVKTKTNSKIILDKDFLYHADLRNSLVMIDEARTVWNARAYQNWSEEDEEFFNFIRKNNTYVILATQRYDGIDLNCRCAADYTFFIQPHPFFRNISTVDISRSVQLKISDKNTQVVSRGYSKNATKVVWDIGEVPIAYSWFFRKKFYNKFDTRFVNNNFDDSFKPELWDDELITGKASELPDVEDITNLILQTDNSSQSDVDISSLLNV